MESKVEDLTTYPTETIEHLIGRWQNVQKCNPFQSKDWLWASDALKPLFAEMSRRQKVGAL